MMTLGQRLCAEGLGSLLLAAAVVGSGVMAERLAGGNVAIALLANTGATVAVLAVLIAMLAPVSGAHFNPAVSLIQCLRGELSARDTAAYALIQLVGCLAGAWLAHAMFDLPILQSSTHVRTGLGQWLAEVVATGGLVLVVVSARTPDAAAWRVSAWIGGAYWFTSSTSFANPAITVARAFSDTFAGIRPADVPVFVGAQLAGALAGLVLSGYLWRRASRPGALTISG